MSDSIMTDDITSIAISVLRDQGHTDAAAGDAPRLIAEMWAKNTEDPYAAAVYLAETLHAKHYSHVTQWRPLEDTAGVISQIDNMVAGLVPKPQQQDEGIPSTGGEWRPIETAPKDGTHILAAHAGGTFGWMNGVELPPVQTVVHWWDNPGEEGFYTSVSEVEPQNPFNATHWQPLTYIGTPSETGGKS